MLLHNTVQSKLMHGRIYCSKNNRALVWASAVFMISFLEGSTNLPTWDIKDVGFVTNLESGKTFVIVESTLSSARNFCLIRGVWGTDYMDLKYLNEISNIGLSFVRTASCFGVLSLTFLSHEISLSDKRKVADLII
jgi:hypothetical protein